MIVLSMISKLIMINSIIHFFSTFLRLSETWHDDQHDDDDDDDDDGDDQTIILDIIITFFRLL